jgi:hypothetical protein
LGRIEGWTRRYRLYIRFGIFLILRQVRGHLLYVVVLLFVV